MDIQVEKLRSLDSSFTELRELPKFVLDAEFRTRQHDVLVSKRIWGVDYILNELDLYPPVREARELFRALPLWQAIKFAFSLETADLAILKYIKATLATRYGKHCHNWSVRSRFVFWVYREKELAKSLAYLRPATASKHKVVHDLLKPLRSKQPRISSKVVHAWAFRPKFFENDARFEPIYKRVVIAKGRRGHRFLDVPFRDLAKLQRRILDRILNPLCERLLLPCVFGFCPGSERTIFHGIQSHKKARFVVGFDIENFFSSIKFEMVASTLSGMPPEAFDALGYGRKMHWEWDLVLLLGKLTTWRGRLPQGAPTSPAMANLVFHRYDQKIQSHLGEYFSYSRYADDLTFSISATKAKKLGIKSPLDAQRHVEAALTIILAGSFRLNSGKSRSADLRQGVRVTGLFLDTTSVRLPRSKSRDLRTTLYKISNAGLLATAQTHPRHGQTSPWKNVVGKRGERYQGERSPVSAERLCAVAALKLCTGLMLTDLRNPDDNQPLVGYRLRGTVERVLSHLWRSEVLVQQQSSTEILVTYLDGQPALRLVAKSAIGFLMLGRDDAVSCARLVNGLNGMDSFLNGAPSSPLFNPLKELRGQLQMARENLWLGDISAPTVVSSLNELDKSRPSLSIEDDIWKAADELLSRLKEVYARLNVPVPSPDCGDRFRNAAKTEKALNSWIALSNRLLNDGLPRVPKTPKNARDPLSYIRVHTDQVEGKRSQGYKVEKDYFTGRLRGGLKREDHFLQLQEELLQDTLDLFTAAAPEDWMSNPVDNLRDGTQKAREAVLVELEDLRRQLTSSGDTKLIFAEFNTPERNSTVRQHLENLKQPAEDAGDDSWLALFQFGWLLIKSYDECTERDNSNEYAESVNTYWRGAEGCFRMVALLRNRAAHEWNPSDPNVENANTLQKFVCSKLNRSYRKPEPPDSPGNRESYFTLNLTPFEVDEVKLRILEALRNELQGVLKKMLAVRPPAQDPPPQPRNSGP